VLRTASRQLSLPLAESGLLFTGHQNRITMVFRTPDVNQLPFWVLLLTRTALANRWKWLSDSSVTTSSSIAARPRFGLGL
jgi:hypothetical protein